MSSLMLLPMPAVTRWGHGAGVAGVRAVWRSRWDGRICAPCVIRGASAAKRALPWQDLRAMHSRKAICGAFRIHGAHILPKPARFGCMARESCQGGALFPSGAPSGMHGAKKLPRIAAWERTTAKSCHGLPPENASRRNPAIARHPRAHSVAILSRCLPKRGVSLVRGCRLQGGIGAGPSAADAYGLPGAGRGLVRAARRGAGRDRAFRLLGV